MDPEYIALVTKALLEITEPSTNDNTILFTKPSIHDTVCARALLRHTIHKAEMANADEIARLVQEIAERNIGIEKWIENLLWMDKGYRKLKGFLWLNMKYESKLASAAHQLS